MTQPEHTLGPWEAQAVKIPDNTGGYDWCITDESMAIIAEVFQNIGYAKNESDYPYNQRPVEANARLIALAPELLEALESAVNFYVSKVTTPHMGEACANGFPLPENIDWPPHVVKAHSAIVKVRGHQ